MRSARQQSASVSARHWPSSSSGNNGCSFTFDFTPDQTGLHNLIVSDAGMNEPGGYDLVVLILLSFLLLFMCLTHRQQIIRREAVVLLTIYFVYMGSRVLGAGMGLGS